MTAAQQAHASKIKQLKDEGWDQAVRMRKIAAADKWRNENRRDWEIALGCEVTALYKIVDAYEEALRSLSVEGVEG